MNETLTAPQDPFTRSLTGRKLGRYEVLARLASGGMAGVYVARAIGVAGFERLFAVKVLHPHLAHEEEFISMFLDEARLAARIRHPNVVPTIDISDTPDAGFYLVMEYIEGDHLGALLQRAWKLNARLPWSITMRIVVDALDGLAAAHNLVDETGRRLNLVHRDVSPHNIMVSTDGIARITDFGVAKAEVRLSTTREGQFKGKLAYMAPEHASSGDADQRSDLFSMAIILWECLTGQRLFRAENHAATLNKICLEPIPMPSSVDPALAAFDYVLARGLARDPEQRYQSAEEFAEAIEHAAPSLGGVAKQREVAQLVREFAAEKISHDAELIRSAIAQLALDGPSEPLTMPVPSTHANYPAPVANVPVPMTPPALVAPPPALTAEDASDDELELEPAPRRGWRWVSLVLVLAAGAGIVFTFLNGGEERVRSVQLAPPTPSATPTPSAPAEPTPSAGAAGASAVSAGSANPSASAPTTPPAAVVPPASVDVPAQPAAAAANSDAHPAPVTDARGHHTHEPRKPKDATSTTSTSAQTPGNTTKPPVVVRPVPGDDLILNPYRH